MNSSEDVQPDGRLAYRADIDGLRGLAITLVVGFHYGIPGLTGGFIGVDVFFVISGYLITQILQSMPGAPGQKLIRFASRRVKRLLPSVIFLVAVFTLVVAQFLYFFDVDRFADEAVGFLGFHSNYIYYDQSGYFDADSEEKLLLHSWSLSIEWQFYAIWSAIMVAIIAVTARRTWLAGSALFLLAGSLAWSVTLVEIDKAGAFYLIQSRLWEFLVGGLIALIPVPRLGQAWSSCFAMTGLALIIVPASLFDGTTSFPGLAAIPVTLGTAALIIAGRGSDGRWHHRFFASKPAVLLGQISYSLYLWHWPLLIFATLKLGRQTTIAEKGGLIAFAVLLSLVLWRWLEMPFRRNWRWSDVSVVGTGLGASVALLGLCLVTKEHEGWPLHRKDPLADQLAQQAGELNPLISDCIMTADNLVFEPSRCLFGMPAATPDDADFIVVGDSHGDHWVPGLATLAEQLGLTGLQLTADSCLPIRGIDTIYDGKPYGSCRAFREQAFDFLEGFAEPRTIVLAARWSVYFDTTQFLRPEFHPPYFATDSDNVTLDVPTTRSVIERNLSSTIGWLEERGHRVVLLGQVPEFGFEQVRCVIRRVLDQSDTDGCGSPRSILLDRLDPAHEMLSRVADAHASVRLVFPHEKLCDQSHCRQVADAKILYRDDDHLNVTGSEIVVQMIADDLALHQGSGSPR